MNCSQDTKDKIIEAAGIMIKEKTDVNKITVRGIAKLAGVGTGLINYYFGSKDNLLAAAIEKRVDDAVAQILNRAETVSYTHLDVYKRQDPDMISFLVKM